MSFGLNVPARVSANNSNFSSSVNAVVCVKVRMGEISLKSLFIYLFVHSQRLGLVNILRYN
jgi:hypothetical protein